MKLIKLFSYLFINIVRLLNLVELYQLTYNPKKYPFIKAKFYKRNCHDRLSAIRENINFSCIGSYLDIGSQLGYFVFDLAKLNKTMIAHGIEMNTIACAYSTSILFLNNLKNISFSNTKINPEIVKKIPKYDVISFLDVFHHIVFFDGHEAADEIMHQLYKKCNLYFIFETGQYDEKGYYWSKKLNFMDKNPTKWINDYLLSLGYSEVKLIGEFSTHLSNKKRALFLCKKENEELNN